MNRIPAIEENLDDLRANETGRACDCYLDGGTSVSLGGLLQPEESYSRT
jgi:hypothetical protein